MSTLTEKSGDAWLAMAAGRAGPSCHPDLALAEFALGLLPATGRAELAAHLGGCSRCELELAAMAEVLASLPLAQTAVAPAPGVRARLLAALTGEAQRPAPAGDEGADARRPSAARLARFFDIPEAQAAGVLAAIDAPERWLAIPGGGQLLAVPPGPAHQRVGGVMGMLARFPPGFHMPRHQHRGMERTLVLRGGYRSSDGVTYHPGDEAWGEPGHSHELYVLPDSECVLALLLRDGIEFTPEE